MLEVRDRRRHSVQRRSKWAAAAAAAGAAVAAAAHDAVDELGDELSIVSAVQAPRAQPQVRGLHSFTSQDLNST